MTNESGPVASRAPRRRIIRRAAARCGPGARCEATRPLLRALLRRTRRPPRRSSTASLLLDRVPPRGARARELVRAGGRDKGTSTAAWRPPRCASGSTDRAAGAAPPRWRARARRGRRGAAPPRRAEGLAGSAAWWDVVVDEERAGEEEEERGRGGGRGWRVCGGRAVLRRRQRQRRRGAPGRCVGLLARGQAHHGRHWRSGRLGDQGSERRGEGGGREQWRCPRRRRRQGLPLHEWCRSLPPHLQCLRRGARGGARARAGDHRRRLARLVVGRRAVPLRAVRRRAARHARPRARCGRSAGWAPRWRASSTGSTAGCRPSSAARSSSGCSPPSTRTRGSSTPGARRRR